MVPTGAAVAGKLAVIRPEEGEVISYCAVMSSVCCEVMPGGSGRFIS